MRKLNVVLATLALGAFGAAFAADATATVTSAGTDTLTSTGNLSVSFGNTEFGSAPKSAGSSTLTYSTQDEAVTANRKITVGLALDGALTALPSGLTITLAPSTSNGTAGSVINFSGTTLSSAASLIGAIPQFTTNGTATVSYTVTATKGFNDFTGTLTYTLAAEL